MHYLFFDAAGDLGLKRYPDVKKSASPRPFYVQCIVSTGDKEAINQTIAGLRNSFKFKTDYEFKYSKYLDQSKRDTFFQAVAKLDFKAYAGVLDKDNSLSVASFSNLGGNDLTAKLLIPLIMEALPGIAKFCCIIDEAKQAKDVARRIRVEISKELKANAIPAICDYVRPMDSGKESCLQLADMIADIVMDSFERNDRVS